MSKPIRFLRWLFDEFMAALLVIALFVMFWVVVLKHHMLPIAHGERGSYAEVSIPEILTLDTKLISFKASVAPGRVATLIGTPILPLPDMLHVEVRYSDSDRVERTWEQSFFIVCDEDEYCAPVTALSGAVLAGRARNGGAEVLAWAPLNPQVPLLRDRSVKPEDEPQQSPKPTQKQRSAPLQAT
jgi:hypothetical protein